MNLRQLTTSSTGQSSSSQDLEQRCFCSQPCSSIPLDVTTTDKMAYNNAAQKAYPELQHNLTLRQRNPTSSAPKKSDSALPNLAFRDRQRPNGIAQPQHDDGARMSNAKGEMKDGGVDGKAIPYRNAASKQLDRGRDSRGSTSKWAPSSSYRGPRDDRSRSPKRSLKNDKSRISQPRRGTMRLSSKEAPDAVYNISRTLCFLKAA